MRSNGTGGSPLFFVVWEQFGVKIAFIDVQVVFLTQLGVSWTPTGYDLEIHV